MIRDISRPSSKYRKGDTVHASCRRHLVGQVPFNSVVGYHKVNYGLQLLCEECASKANRSTDSLCATFSNIRIIFNHTSH